MKARGSVLIASAFVLSTTPASAQVKPVEPGEEATGDPPPLRVVPVRERADVDTLVPQPMTPPAPVSAPPSPPPPSSLVRPAYPRNQARWGSQITYPRNQDFLGEEGVTGFRVTVSPQGRVDSCTVTSSSGFDQLDEATCRGITRYARFDPARDAQGNPTTGLYVNRIRWQTEGDKPFSPGRMGWAYPKDARAQKIEGRVGIRFDVDTDGKVSNCMITRSSGSHILDGATCSYTEKLRGSRSTATGDGVPRSRTVRRSVEWTLSGKQPAAIETAGPAPVPIRATAQTRNDRTGESSVPVNVEPVQTRQLKESRGERVYYAPAPPDYAPKGVPDPIDRESDWITDADYPAEAWLNGEKGLVQYELKVDETGNPTDCTINYSDATTTLEATTCRLLMERARFKPGVNDEGEPIAALYGNEHYWRIREPEYTGSFTMRIGFLIDEAGKMQNCETIERSGTIPRDMARTLETRPCPTGGIVGIPYRDENGVPVPKQVSIEVSAIVEDVEPANGEDD